MIDINVTSCQQAGVGMPMSGRDHVVSACAFPTATAGVWAVTSGVKRDLDVTTGVFVGRSTDSALRTNVFPGISAWRPPN